MQRTYDLVKEDPKTGIQQIINRGMDYLEALNQWKNKKWQGTEGNLVYRILSSKEPANENRKSVKGKPYGTGPTTPQVSSASDP